MALTHFPQGLSSFGVPLLGGPTPPSTGLVFWVDSNAGFAAGANGDIDNPFPTIVAALADSRLLTNTDVTIMVKARHAETVTAAGTLTISKAGVRILGLGRGRQRPTISLTTATAANVVISGASTWLDNFVISSNNFDAIASVITVTGADCWISNCEFVMADAAEQTVLAITLGTGASRARIQGNTFGASDAGATAAISIIAAVDAVVIADNHFTGDYGTAAINNITAAATNIRILRNSYYGTNASEPIIEMITGATGIAAYNVSYGATFAAGGGIVGDAIAKFENYLTDTLANSGILDPTGVTL
jgi:hypothetical protein